MKKLVFLAVLFSLFVMSGCRNKDAEISSLEEQVKQQKIVIAKFQKVTSEIERLKELTQSVTMPMMKVLDSLDAIDNDVYDGAFVNRARSYNSSREEIVAAYYALLGQIENDLR
jgi:hypothetical protein